jgi:hypothetical protein
MPASKSSRRAASPGGKPKRGSRLRWSPDSASARIWMAEGGRRAAFDFFGGPLPETFPFASVLDNFLASCPQRRHYFAIRQERWWVMDCDRSKVVVAYEQLLVRLASEKREPTAWEESNLLEALVAIVSGNYLNAMDYIGAAKRGPADSEIAEMKWRSRLSLVEIRERFEDLRGAKLFHELDSSKSAESLPMYLRRDLPYHPDDEKKALAE